MKFLNKRSTRLILLGLVAIFALLENRFQREHSRRIRLLSAGLIGLPSGGVAPNETGGKIPGHPAKAFADALILYHQIAVYRKYHQGKYPDGNDTLTTDRIQNYTQYGYNHIEDAYHPFANPDSRYSDDPNDRLHIGVADPFIIPSTRPDGTALGTSKPLGTRDVVAFSMLYYHENVRNFNNAHSLFNPVGFFIVVWDNGSIEKVSYNHVLFVRDPKLGGYVYAFPKEAGVPPSAVSFDTFYKRIPRGRVASNQPATTVAKP